MAVNVLEQLQRQQEMASQQQESLSQRLARQDAFNSSVDPAIRAQALDFSNRPTLANPLDTIAGQLDLGERARSQRSAIAEDLGRVQSQSMDLLTKIGSEQQRRASAGAGATKAKTASEELSRMAGLADALGLDKQKLIQSRPDLIAQAFGLEDLLMGAETQQPEPSLLTAGARGMQVGAEQATGQPMPEIERQQPTGFEAIQQLFQPQQSDLVSAVQNGVVDVKDLTTEQKIQLDKDARSMGVELPKDKAIEERQDLVDLLQTLRGRSFGPVSGKLAIRGRIGGTEAAYTANLLKQLNSKLTVEEREKLKGQGTITDTETKLLADAQAALGLNEKGISNLSSKNLQREIDKIIRGLGYDPETFLDQQQPQPSVPTNSFNTSSGNKIEIIELGD